MKSALLSNCSVSSPCQQDALLLHIVPIYDAKDWVSIAKHMGGDVTNEQCRNRWCCKVDPSLNACKSGPWEPEEVWQPASSHPPATHLTAWLTCLLLYCTGEPHAGADPAVHEPP